MSATSYFSHAPQRYASCVWTVIAALVLTACADFSGIHASSELRSAQSLGLAAGSVSSSTTETNMDVKSAMTDSETWSEFTRWWEGLGAAPLNDLVQQALAESPNIRLAQARLAKAQAGIDGARAQDSPNVSAQGSVTRQHFNEHGLYPAPVAGSEYDNASMQLNGRWEWDVFGRNRAALDAAIGSARAVQADTQAARLLLTTQVVQAYIEIARLQDQLTVAKRTLEQRSETLKLVQQRFDAGLDTTLEVRQSEGSLPEARVQIEQLQEQLALAHNALAALVGQPQLVTALTAQTPTTLSHLQNFEVPHTLPAELLGRRADVVAARWRVEAASEGMAEAKAEFYPNISLTAFLSLASLDLGQWINTGSRTWGVGPAISLPIFDGGRLRANLQGRTADYDAAVEIYNQSVIGAVKETTDQLTSLAAIARQQAQQSDALAAAESAYHIARDRYAAGLGTYLNVLTAESAVLVQQRLHVDLQARALQTRVALVHALGGGYEPESPVSTHTPNELSATAQAAIR